MAPWPPWKSFLSRWENLKLWLGRIGMVGEKRTPSRQKASEGTRFSDVWPGFPKSWERLWKQTK